MADKSFYNLLNPSRSKVNVISWKSDDRPGLRTMWVKYVTGLLLLLEGYGAYKLRHDYSDWSLSGPIIAILVYLSLVWIYHETGEQAKWLGVLVGFLWASLLWIASLFWDVDGQGLALGLLVLALVLTYVSNGLTTWYPHQRDTQNRGA